MKTFFYHKKCLDKRNLTLNTLPPWDIKGLSIIRKEGIVVKDLECRLCNDFILIGEEIVASFHGQKEELANFNFSSYLKEKVI